MNQASQKKSSWRVWLLVGLLLLAAVGAAFWLYSNKAANQSSFQTTTARRGALSSSVSADGTVRAGRSAVLKWNTAGRVQSVNAAIGSQVSADQVLAELAPDSVSRPILLAQADLVTAQQNLDNLLQSNITTAQAMQNLADAGQHVKDAQDAYDTLTRKRVSDQLISDTSDQIENAKKRLKFLEFIYRLFYEHRAEGSTDKSQFIVTLTQNKQNIADLTARYNWYVSSASPISVQESLAALNLAKARQADAQREMDRLANGPTTDDLAAARARVAAAQATVNLAKVLAPFSGTITQALPQAGDRVSASQTAFRVDDLSQLMVDLKISEVDINSVVVGQAVSIVMDAAPGKTYEGTVSSVDQSAQGGQGGVNFKVVVTINNPDEQVKPGMTASVTITTKNVEDALLVPNSAVRMISGQRVVFVLRNKQPVPANIRLGATADEQSQVVGGDLKEGDLIILNPPASLVNSLQNSMPSPTPAN